MKRPHHHHPFARPHPRARGRTGNQLYITGLDRSISGGARTCYGRATDSFHQAAQTKLRRQDKTTSVSRGSGASTRRVRSHGHGPIPSDAATGRKSTTSHALPVCNASHKPTKHAVVSRFPPADTHHPSSAPRPVSPRQQARHHEGIKVVVPKTCEASSLRTPPLPSNPGTCNLRRGPKRRWR